MVTLPAPADERCGLFVGQVRHRRHQPISHLFTYPVVMALLDIDAVPQLMARSRLTSLNRFNLAAFFERDHLDPGQGSMRTRLAADAARQGIVLPDGPVLLLTQLRYAGYVFNPVSFYYCYQQTGALAYVMAEVNNTFGGRHHYWLAPESQTLPGPVSALFRAGSTKGLYVSPFMEDHLYYRFAISRPAATLSIHMTATVDGDERPRFDATLSLARHEWTATTVRRVLVRYPLSTVRVIAGIHWEALKLWRRGVPVVPRLHPNGLFTVGDGTTEHGGTGA